MEDIGGATPSKSRKTASKPPLALPQWVINPSWKSVDETCKYISVYTHIFITSFSFSIYNIKADTEEVSMYIMFYMTMLQYSLLHSTHFITIYNMFLGISHADFCFLFYSNSSKYLNAAKHAAINNCSSSVVTSSFLTVH